MDTQTIYRLILILILTLCNAFFAASEMAIVSVNKNKMMAKAEKGDKRAQLLLQLLEEPSKFLATIQVGITFAGFFSSAFAATGMTDGLSETLSTMHVPYSDQIALIIITVLLSYVMLVLGELLPKRIAMQQTENLALFAVKPIYTLSKITKPFVKLLSVSTNVLLHLVGIKDDNLEEKVSEEEIRSLVKVGEEMGVFNSTEKQMINSIFEFDDTLVKHIMTPRLEISMIDLNWDEDAIKDYLKACPYSRVPVYDDEKEAIVGILLTKTLIKSLLDQNFDKDIMIKALLEPAFYPETLATDQLFVQMQRKKEHFAIIIDEYGVFSGVVTLEDLIEEVMGDIDDEYSNHDSEIQHLTYHQYLIDGHTSVKKLNDVLELNLDESIADTINGLMVHHLKEIPDESQHKVVHLDNLTFEIIAIKDKRIEQLKLVIDGEHDEEQS